MVAMHLSVGYSESGLSFMADSYFIFLMYFIKTFLVYLVPNR